MARLRQIGPLVRTRIDSRILKPVPKKAEPLYLSEEYRRWRAIVIDRAGGRCQALNADGMRCMKAEPEHRMFADHIIELIDGGMPFDPINGQCLCGSHHTIKTMKARTARLRPSVR